MSTPRRRGRPWERTRRYVLQRDGYRCQIAGPTCTRTATQVDHIVPLAAGGNELDPTNLRAACSTCNASRGGKVAARTLATYGRTQSRW